MYIPDRVLKKKMEKERRTGTVDVMVSNKSKRKLPFFFFLLILLLLFIMAEGGEEALD